MPREWRNPAAAGAANGPVVEVYLNDARTSAPADLATEVRLPLA